LPQGYIGTTNGRKEGTALEKFGGEDANTHEPPEGSFAHQHVADPVLVGLGVVFTNLQGVECRVSLQKRVLLVTLVSIEPQKPILKMLVNFSANLGGPEMFVNL
jgi:hypothetical protein